MTTRCGGGKMVADDDPPTKERPPVPTPDVAAIDETIAAIAAAPNAASVPEPETGPLAWTQDEWRCPSGMCLAGWRAHLDGVRWLFDPLGNGVINDPGRPVDMLMPGRTAFIVAPDDFPEGERADWYDHDRRFDGLVHVEDYARVRFGLSRAESTRLFHYENDLSDIRAIRDDIAAHGEG